MINDFGDTNFEEFLAPSLTSSLLDDKSWSDKEIEYLPMIRKDYMALNKKTQYVGVSWIIFFF